MPGVPARRAAGLGMVVALGFLPAATAPAHSADGARAHLDPKVAAPGLFFEPNIGQAAAPVTFLARAPGYTFIAPLTATALGSCTSQRSDRA